jgi:hypothetical protein
VVLAHDRVIGQRSNVEPRVEHRLERNRRVANGIAGVDGVVVQIGVYDEQVREQS